MAVTTEAVVGERELVESVRLDDAWSLVEEFSTLVRESGSDDERRAVDAITSRLELGELRAAVAEPDELRRQGLGPLEPAVGLVVVVEAEVADRTARRLPAHRHLTEVDRVDDGEHGALLVLADEVGAVREALRPLLEAASARHA